MKRTLKELRIERGLTQRGLAEMIGVEIRTWRRYENGERKIPGEALQIVAEKLNVVEREIELSNFEERLTYEK